MYACLYICICFCMYVHIHMWVCVNICVYVPAYMCVCMRVHVNMYVCIYLCTYVCTCLCMYVDTQPKSSPTLQHFTPRLFFFFLVSFFSFEISGICIRQTADSWREGLARSAMKTRFQVSLVGLWASNTRHTQTWKRYRLMTQKTLSEAIINLSLPAALFGNKVNCEFPCMPPCQHTRLVNKVCRE